MEYCAAGSASDLMAICDVTFDEAQISEAAAAILLGLEYLHSKKLIHRDLKCGNVLLSSNGQAKLVSQNSSRAHCSARDATNRVENDPLWTGAYSLRLVQQEGVILPSA